jgi:SAM-dependent methyltransferase
MTQYVHGYSKEEQRRLTVMQRLLNESELAVLDLEGVRSILDVGAGLGQMTRALARAAGPEARAVGVERDPEQIAEARRQASADGEDNLVELRPGEAERLPLSTPEWGTFDVAHARFILEHVRNPLAVVQQMVAAVRPGGRLCLLDDDHEALSLWPSPPPALQHAWERYWQSYRRIGCDPLVGRRLPALLYEAGAPALRVTTVFFGACAGSPTFGLVVDNLRHVLSGSAASLAEGDLLSQVEVDEALGALDQWRTDPTATIWYSLPFAEGRRPG